MAKSGIYIGQLNRSVEIFLYIDVTTSTGEAVKTPQSYGQKFAKRINPQGGEELDGRLVPLGVCRFIIRYNLHILDNGTKYFVRDLDGDWEINSVAEVEGDNSQRRRFMELKCTKRG